MKPNLKNTKFHLSKSNNTFSHPTNQFPSFNRSFTNTFPSFFAGREIRGGGVRGRFPITLGKKSVGFVRHAPRSQGAINHTGYEIRVALQTSMRQVTRFPLRSGAGCVPAYPPSLPRSLHPLVPSRFFF